MEDQKGWVVSELKPGQGLKVHTRKAGLYHEADFGPEYHKKIWNPAFK